MAKCNIESTVIIVRRCASLSLSLLHLVRLSCALCTESVCVCVRRCLSFGQNDHSSSSLPKCHSFHGCVVSQTWRILPVHTFTPTGKIVVGMTQFNCRSNRMRPNMKIVNCSPSKRRRPHCRVCVSTHKMNVRCGHKSCGSSFLFAFSIRHHRCDADIEQKRGNNSKYTSCVLCCVCVYRTRFDA